MSEFGNILRKYRQSTRDPNSGKQLSQEYLGELVGDELGSTGYSGAAVSDWERGQGKISADDRVVLISILKVLYKYNGFKAIVEANELLEAGNYRALNFSELIEVFPQAIVNEQTTSSVAPQSSEQLEYIKFLKDQILHGIFGEKIKAKLAAVQDGPKPAWPRQIVALLNELTERWTPYKTLQLLVWIGTWWLSFWLITPSMHWPFTNQDDALIAMVLYGAGALIIPVFIGVIAKTHNHPFWQNYFPNENYVLRLYTYQGAGIGFYLGYMGIFAINLVLYYLNSSPLDPVIKIPLEAIEITLLLLISRGCSQLVPYNMWKAFGRLDLIDGGIFFTFFVISPLWGIFFYLSYPFLLERVTGTILILTVIALIALAEIRQHKLTGQTIIPTHWHTSFYGFIAIIHEAAVSSNLFTVVALAGLVITVSVLLSIDRIRYTVRGMISFPVTLYLSILVFQWNRWIGYAILAFIVLVWCIWGRRHMSFPATFWVVIFSLTICYWLWQYQWLPDLWVSLLFCTSIALVLFWERKLLGTF